MENRKDKLKTFINDGEMERAVKSVILRVFLKTPSQRDVQTLAARWLAKDLIDDAWRELEKYKSDQLTTKKEVTNIGV